VKWLADENLDNDIIRGLLRRLPGFDVVRVQDLDEISGCDDSVLLSWATENNRILLIHDLTTMVPAIQQQLRSGSCAPIVLVPDSLPVGTVIEDILLLESCAIQSDWAAGVIYLPLR
jgi:Domain of unknown function (DUF5615)